MRSAASRTATAVEMRRIGPPLVGNRGDGVGALSSERSPRARRPQQRTDPRFKPGSPFFRCSPAELYHMTALRRPLSAVARTIGGMPSAIRIGTCSWADESLTKYFYPSSVKGAEERLRYYADRFDTVEANSTYYRLPD